MIDPSDDIQQSAGADGHSRVRDLVRTEGAFMRSQAERIGRLYGVDADDLLQETLIRLFRARQVEPGRTGMRRYLVQGMQWKALDMLRRTERELAASPASIQELEEVTSAAANRAATGDDALDVDMLHRVGLSTNQARMVALLSWADVPMNEYAGQVERSYAAIRKDRTRGLRKLEELFGLTTMERGCFVSYRMSGSIGRVAEEMDVPEEVARCELRHAQEKVRRVFLIIVTGSAEDGSEPAASPSSGRCRPPDLRELKRLTSCTFDLPCDHDAEPRRTEDGDR